MATMTREAAVKRLRELAARMRKAAAAANARSRWEGGPDTITTIQNEQDAQAIELLLGETR